MDTFLTGLYHEEMEKGASSQMGEFMDSLPAGDLEQYLGLDKLAVGGSSNPPLPDSAQGAELDAKQKAVNENCCKEHLSSIPKRSDGADPSVSFQSEGKQPTESPDEAKQVSKQAMACADYVGRMMAKEALAPLIGGLSGYLSQGDPDATPKSGFWRGAGLGTLGAIGGGMLGGLTRNPGVAGLGALAGSVGGGILGGRSAKLGPAERKAYLKQKASMLKAKIKDKTAAAKDIQQTHRSGAIPLSPGYGAALGGIGGGVLGASGGARIGREFGGTRGALLGAGAGALGLGALGAGGGAALSALKRAQLKSDKKQIAKINKEGSAEGMEKDDAFTSPEAKNKAKVMRATMKASKGAPSKERKAVLGRVGQMKVSQGYPGDGDGGDDGGMTTMASARAEIAARALRSTSGAPQHIKMAAAALAGRQIANLATKM